MAQHLNYERAAAILVDAAYLGDEAAAKKWQVSVRTIKNYRDRLKVDAKLSEFFHRKRGVAEGHWSTELKRALRSVLTKAAQIAESIEVVESIELEFGGQIQRVNMDALTILIAAGKGLGEIALALEVLNAGDAHQNANAPAPGAGLENRPPLN